MSKRSLKRRRRSRRAAGPWSPIYWPHLAGLGLLWCISKLPWRAQLACGRAVGRLAFRLARERRHVVMCNLKLCFPELSAQQRHALGRSHFESVGMGLVELGMSWWSPDSYLRGRLTIDGHEHLRAAQREGRAVILLSCHMTSIDICGRLFSPHADFDVLYRRHQIPIVDRIMCRHRSRFFHQAIRRDDIRGMIRALRRGRAVWYAPDQSYRGKYSVIAPFFGQAAPTNPGTARIAGMTNAVVIPLHMERRLDSGGYHISLSEPLRDFPSGDPEIDAARINQVFEDLIRRCPAQYLWLHRRFKKRPPGYADAYAGAIT